MLTSYPMPSFSQPISVSAATTRRTRSIHVPHSSSRHFLVPDQVITSPETGLRYRVDRLIGKGGFGEAYLAARLGRSTAVPETVCIKVSDRIDGWVREAYFGKLLDGHPRAIRVFDMFPLMRADGRVLYYLALADWRAAISSRRSSTGASASGASGTRAPAS